MLLHLEDAPALAKDASARGARQERVEAHGADAEVCVGGVGGPVAEEELPSRGTLDRSILGHLGVLLHLNVAAARAVDNVNVLWFAVGCGLEAGGGDVAAGVEDRHAHAPAVRLRLLAEKLAHARLVLGHHRHEWVRRQPVVRWTPPVEHHGTAEDTGGAHDHLQREGDYDCRGHSSRLRRLGARRSALFRGVSVVGLEGEKKKHETSRTSFFE